MHEFQAKLIKSLDSLLFWGLVKSLDCFIDPFQWAQLGEGGLEELARGLQPGGPS